VVSLDKSGTNTAALAMLNAGKPEGETIMVRQNKHLNNLVEQDYRNIKCRIKLITGFQSFTDLLPLMRQDRKYR